MTRDRVEDCSAAEMMCIAAARCLEGSGVAFVGLGLPVLSALVTKQLHDPGIVYCTEIGVMDWQADPAVVTRAPRGIGDPILTYGAAYVGDMLDALGILLMGGHIDTAVLSGAQIDKFGNLNTLLRGTYRSPTRRFPGTGGNTDAACLAKRSITIMALESRRLAERVDFLTSPGYVDGPGGRRRAGLDPQGPNLVVSTMGIFGFDTADGGETGSCEMQLRAVMPGATVEQIAAIFPWDLQIAANVTQIDPPTHDELALLRKLDESKFYLRDGRY